MPEDITHEDVDTLRSIYREHCEAFLDAILSLDFSTIESLWREFWRAQDNNNGDECEEEKYLSKYKLYNLVQCKAVQEFIKEVSETLSLSKLLWNSLENPKFMNRERKKNQLTKTKLFSISDWLQFLPEYGRCSYTKCTASDSQCTYSSYTKFCKESRELDDISNDWLPGTNRSNQIGRCVSVQSNIASVYIFKSFGPSCTCRTSE